VKARYFIPLLGFAVPSLLIGFGFVIPGSCIEGVNNLTVGFAATIIGASVTYWLGILAVLADRDRPRRPGTGP
jgi:ABC-type Fe3+ transport system permease subunit